MVRKSKKRDAIYRALCALKTHPCAETLYARLKPSFPDLSLGTVYGNLAAFKREGLAVSVGVVDGRERFDGDTAPHAHFICRRCGAVIDVWETEPPEPPPLPGKADERRVSWRGVCEACLQEENE
jgi:Fur family peroxide stress response transcriptional regulator